MQKDKELELITDLTAVLFIKDTGEIWSVVQENRLRELVKRIENSLPEEGDAMQDPEVLELIFQKYGV